MKDSFQIGDVVQLKSGGPAMTVDEVTAADGVWAVWFAYGKDHRRRFAMLSLQRAKPRKARVRGTTACAGAPV
jgi:uncharacterized protein YodC (DUF2158 family)